MVIPEQNTSIRNLRKSRNLKKSVQDSEPHLIPSLLLERKSFSSVVVVPDANMYGKRGIEEIKVKEVGERKERLHPREALVLRKLILVNGIITLLGLLLDIYGIYDLSLTLAIIGLTPTLGSLFSLPN